MKRQRGKFSRDHASLGKQNVQAKEGYYVGEHFDAEYNCIGILQFTLCHL